MPDPTQTATLDRDLLVDAAAELLLAAITMVDLVSSLHPQVLVACPEDILTRLTSHRYQGAFNALPADVRAEARARVEAHPAIVAARRIDREGRRA